MKDPTEEYEAWRADPRPENLARAVKALEPVYVSALGKEGMIGDPFMRSKAKVVTAEAIRTYDPAAVEGASLPTWVSHQMVRLGRARRLQSQTTRLPERVQTDRWKMEQVRADLADELGREPSVAELADRTTLSPKRLKELATYNLSMPSEAAFEGAVPNEQLVDYDAEALEYVYQEADPVDQMILEHTLGYGGKPILDNNSLMKKTKLDPTQMTRRRQRLTYKLNNTLELLRK